MYGFPCDCMRNGKSGGMPREDGSEPQLYYLRREKLQLGVKLCNPVLHEETHQVESDYQVLIL